MKPKRPSRRVSASAAVLALMAAVGCSGGTHSTNIDAVLPAPVCGGDVPAGTGPTCWATDRIATRTGCSDTHCVRDGSIVARAPLYAACGIAAPDPASPAPASGLIGAAGAFSLDDDLCEFHAVVVPSCAGSGTAVSFDVQLSTKSGETVPPAAAPYAEAFLTPIPIAQDTGTGTEMAPGRYRVGPVSFDASGTWTVTPSTCSERAATTCPKARTRTSRCSCKFLERPHARRSMVATARARRPRCDRRLRRRSRDGDALIHEARVVRVARTRRLSTSVTSK